MSKAILAMDMPKDCYECKLQDWLTCRIAKKCNTSHLRPEWCPLREAPQKKDVSMYKGLMGASTLQVLSYKQGYNACIDEILKGSETDV